MAELHRKYLCCFCGETIRESAVDPCAIVLVGNWAGPEAEQAEQQFFCHVACFKKAMCPSVRVEISGRFADKNDRSHQ